MSRRKQPAVAPIESLESRLLMAIVPVLNTNNSGVGSLRDAIAAAAAGDVIDLSGVTGTIALTSELNVTRDVTLQGPGRDRLTISGEHRTRVMLVNSPVTVRLADLTIARGSAISAGSGSAIYNNTGNLVLDRVTFRNNVARTGYTGSGGAIYSSGGSFAATDCEFVDNVSGSLAGAVQINNGALSILRCTFARNRAGGFGGDNTSQAGAMRIGGAVTGSIVNTTFSDNAALGAAAGYGGAQGGALEVSTTGRLDFINCTITGNAVGTPGARGEGGGVYVWNGSAPATVYFTNCIVAGNYASTSGHDVFATARAASGGHNLIGAIDGWTGGPTNNNPLGDRVGTAANPLDPMLAPLSSNGGLTQTHRPLAGSPAIDSGGVAGDPAPLTDQTGAARVGAVDIGAAEFLPVYFTSTPPRNVYLAAGAAFTYTAAAAHHGAAALVISATSKPSLPAWLTFTDHGDGTATLAGTADATSGTYVIVLTAADAAGADAEQSFVLHVAQENVAPAITSAPVLAATADQRYSYKLIATDANGDQLAFTSVTLPSWLTLEDHGDGTATLYGNPRNANAGTHAVSVQVSDGHASATQTFNVVVTRVNHAAMMYGPSPANQAAFQPMLFTSAAYDEDGDALTLTLVSKPAWLTVTDNNNGTVTFTGTPTNADVGGNTVSIRISDGVGNITRSFFFNVTYVNRAPSFVTTTVPSGFARMPYSATVTASDPDNDKVTITAVSRPGWLVVTDNGNGTASLSGTPNVAPGSYNFTLRVRDAAGASTDRQFTLVLPNRAPTVTLTASAAAIADQPYSATLTGEDADLDSVTMTVLSMPSWLTYSTTSLAIKVLSGTPNNAHAALQNVVIVRLSDGVTTVDRSVTIPVTPVNHAPQMPSQATDTVSSESPYSGTFYPQDVDGDALTFSAIGKPAWLALVDNRNNTVTFTGTPTNADAGVTTFTVRVSDGSAFAEMTYTITVLPVNHAPTFAGAATTSVVAGTPFFHTINTLDVDGDARTITAVSLPAWMTLTDNGNGTATLTGVATDIDGGINPFVLRVSDGEKSTEQTFNVEVLVERFRLINGVLQVTGGVEADTISVWIRDTQVRAVRNGVIKNYPMASVKEVQLLGFDGNDSLNVNTRHIPAYAVGGAGNDTILGGDEPDNFVGGGGKDVLDSGGGNDRLDGGNGNDKLLGGAGDDRLIGNDGNDVLFGGEDRDEFFGGLGDDVLYSRDSFPDLLTGGSGANSAQLDAWDVQFDILALLP